MTIRNLPEETHRALKQRAMLHGKSTEAEVRAILEEVVRPKQQVGLATALAEFAAGYEGLELALTRDSAPTEAVSFD